jgi:hypothetical protein
MSAAQFRKLYELVMVSDPDTSDSELATLLEEGVESTRQRKKAGLLTEDLHHDFKSWRVLEDKQRRLSLRSDVAAFANSDGGLIIIGVEDGTLEIQGCDAKDAQRSIDALQQSIAAIAAQISPPPVPRGVPIEGRGVVVLVAVPRSERLVQTVVGSTPTYPLRFGAGTLSSPPEYLLTDLVLGRRTQPMLEIVEPRAGRVDVDFERKAVSVGFVVENVGFSWVEALAVGCVLRAPPDKDARALGRPLEGVIIDCHDSSLVRGESIVSHVSMTAPYQQQEFPLRPFARTPPLSLVLNVQGASAADICFGVYVTPRGSKPIWFQARVALRGPQAHAPVVSIAPAALVMVGWKRPSEGPQQ